MKTISVETNNRIHRVTIGPDGLQSRCLSKGPDEPELKRQYEEEQKQIQADIEQELREEHGNALSEEEIQEYIAEQMQTMYSDEDEEDDDELYGRSSTSFIDVPLYDATNPQIQITNKTKGAIQIRLMLLGGSYGPLCIVDEIIEDLTDQRVIREGVAEILNTIAATYPHETSLASHMKMICDKMDHDLRLLEETRC